MKDPKFKVGDIIVYTRQNLTAEIYTIELDGYKDRWYYICKNWSDGVQSAGAWEDEIRPLTKLDKALK